MLACHPQWLPRPATTQLYSALFIGWVDWQGTGVHGGRQKEWSSSACLSLKQQQGSCTCSPSRSTAMHVPHPADRPEGPLHPKILEEPLDFVHPLIHGGNLRQTNHKESGGRGQRLETEAGNSSMALRQFLSLGFPTGMPGGGVTVPLFFFFCLFPVG